MMDEDDIDESFYSSSVSSVGSGRYLTKSAELRLSNEIVNDDLEFNTSSENVVDPQAMTSESVTYESLNYHWFYSQHDSMNKEIWLAMSYKDTANMELIYTKNTKEINTLRANSQQAQSQPSKALKDKYIVAIKGGRFEVDLIKLEMRPVYWSEVKVSRVRRSLWFYRESNEQQFVPYEEEYSEFLEIEYEKTIKKNTFHKRIDYPGSRARSEVATGASTAVSSTEVKKVDEATGSTSSSGQSPTRSCSISNEEAFVFHSTTIMLHFTQATMLDEYGNLNVSLFNVSDAQRPRIVKRGVLEVVEKIEADEVDNIDHLCFVVHGIGEACDLKFRPIVECVDDFRFIGSYITQSHLKSYIDTKQINGRVEFIPISWHAELHDPTGIDKRLKPLSLTSIPKLREFSNTTILDVLFYTSPIYCQTIIDRVGSEMNRLIAIFKKRNPEFKGEVSLVGHSLGSLICFDILSNQHSTNEDKEISVEATIKKDASLNNIDLTESMEDVLTRLELTDFMSSFEREKINSQNLRLLTESDLVEMGLPIGPRRVLLNEIKAINFQKEKEMIKKQIENNLASSASCDRLKNGLAGTGQIMVKYPQLSFPVAKFFALGSPISMFQTVRGIEKIDTDFKFPTCDEFYNIFHPYDPIAYRFEPLVCSDVLLKPVLLPHHKGRKRMHIELKEGLSKVSEDMLKVGGDMIKNAWSFVDDTQAFFKKLPRPTLNAIEASVRPGQEKEKKESPMAMQEVIGEVTESAQLANGSGPTTSQADLIRQEKEQEKMEESKCNFGRINKGKRIDHVLQESPFESFNEYLFALHSHACYWESEDTLLMIIKQIYGYENIVDANVEMKMTESSHQQPSSWLTQAATQAFSAKVQETISYFQLGLPQSLTNVLPPTSLSSNK